MSLIKKNAQRTWRRKMRVRKAFKDIQCPRVSVFKSAAHIYGQLIDDQKGITLASCSTLEIKDVAGDKTAVAQAIGVELAKRSLQKGVEKIVFDRGSFLYHGRVKAFAEGLRSGGLKF
ncbi:MAG: 50S ribosomal protein L18 [Candidatus Babeliales bacterium]